MLHTYMHIMCMCTILCSSMKRLLDLDIAWWSDLPTDVFDDFDDHIDLEPLDDDSKLKTTQTRE